MVTLRSEDVVVLEYLDSGLHVVKTQTEMFKLGEGGNIRRLGNAQCNTDTLIGSIPRWHHHELYSRISDDFGG